MIGTTETNYNVTTASLPRFSWGAAFAGAFVAIASMVLLGELCAGMGWGLMSPRAEHGGGPSVGSIAAIGVIATIISGMIALFLGGWTAGHIARRAHSTESTLHGVVVWAVTTVLVALMAASAIGLAIGGSISLFGSVIRGAGSAAGGLAQGAGSTMGAAANAVAAHPTYAWDRIRDEAEDAFASRSSTSNQPSAQASGATPADAAAPAPAVGQAGAADAQSAGATSPAAGMHAALGLAKQMFGSPESTPSQADQQQLEAALVANAHMTTEQAHRQVQAWMQEAQEAKQRYDQAVADAEAKARSATASAAKFAAALAFAAFAGTLLGLACAALGGHVGGMTAGTHEGRALGEPSRATHPGMAPHASHAPG